MSCAETPALMAGRHPTVEDEVTRPVLRWHGGKWMLAPATILRHRGTALRSTR